MTTENGRWIKRDADIHRCRKPEYDPSVRRGDEWQCATCNTIWTVTNIDGDQRDGSSWLIWTEKPIITPLAYAYGPYDR